MLTRRVRSRVFLLRPCKQTDRIIRYVVAMEAAAMGIQIHAMVVMSNHWHVCLTDPLRNIAHFQRNCHSFISKALNAHFGECESVWSSSHGSRVECEEPDDLVGEIAYTMANPVKAGLVRHGRSWPGVRHAWPQKPIQVARPPKFFRKPEEGGKWPKSATLTFARPPGYEELSDDELAAVIDTAVHALEDEARTEVDAAGKSFLGRKAILVQRRHSRSRAKESRSRISPKLACRNRSLRIDRLAANKRWRQAYDSAMEQWKAGIRDVLFPYGTYKMSVEHHVACVPAKT